MEWLKGELGLLIHEETRNKSNWTKTWTHASYRWRHSSYIYPWYSPAPSSRVTFSLHPKKEFAQSAIDGSSTLAFVIKQSADPTGPIVRCIVEMPQSGVNASSPRHPLAEHRFVNNV